MRKLCTFVTHTCSCLSRFELFKYAKMPVTKMYERSHLFTVGSNKVKV